MKGNRKEGEKRRKKGEKERKKRKKGEKERKSNKGKSYDKTWGEKRCIFFPNLYGTYLGEK